MFFNYKMIFYFTKGLMLDSQGYNTYFWPHCLKSGIELINKGYLGFDKMIISELERLLSLTDIKIIMEQIKVEFQSLFRKSNSDDLFFPKHRFARANIDIPLFGY